MKPLSFEQLVDELSKKRGGYTLWVGAGAAKALCGTAPTWKELEVRLCERVATSRPSNWEHLDYASRFDWISGELGHAAFRRGLREIVLNPMQTCTINETVADAMAVIGARSSSLVSFNIESISAIPLVAGRGGSITLRPYLPSHLKHVLKLDAQPGSASPPVYFPHGLLDISGNCVITDSEYAVHRMSLAVSTAVSICLGGDLLILGMSLSDRYLREAILQQRRWLRDVFWVGRRFEYREWARMAGVHCVEVDHEHLWTGIASAIVGASATSDLANFWANGLRGRAAQVVATVRSSIDDQRNAIATLGTELAQKPTVTTEHLVHFAQHCIDFGIDVPEAVLVHPAYANAVDWKADGGF